MSVSSASAARRQRPQCINRLDRNRAPAVKKQVRADINSGAVVRQRPLIGPGLASHTIDWAGLASHTIDWAGLASQAIDWAGLASQAIDWV